MLTVKVLRYQRSSGWCKHHRATWHWVSEAFRCTISWNQKPCWFPATAFLAIPVSFGSALSVSGLESRTRDGWQLRSQVVKQKLFKSLMVSDVVKSASASHYGRCTFRQLCVDFNLQLQKVGPDVILVSSTISSPMSRQSWRHSSWLASVFGLFRCEARGPWKWHCKF